MVDLPELSRGASETVSKAKNQVRQLVSWLPDPYTCDDCGTLCKATHTYDPATAAFNQGACPAWECPDCGEEFYRIEPWHGD